MSHPAYDGDSNRTVFFGNDGGVHTAIDLAAVGTEPQPPFTSGWTELDNNYGATMFYVAAGNPVTRNGGADWAPPVSALPPAPVRAVAVHPRRSDPVYLGTEVGVFASEDTGVRWSPTSEGPANCSVNHLIWMDQTLVAVTHGRGMFRIDLSGV